MNCQLLVDFLSKPTLTDYIVAIFTIVLAIVALNQLKIYTEQCQVMREQAELTRKSIEVNEKSTQIALDTLGISQDTAKKQLRAYVHTADAIITHFDAAGDRTVVLTLKNFGQTPAYDMEYWIATHLTIYPFRIASLPEDFTPPAPISRTLIPPGEATLVQISFPEYTNQIKQALLSGEVALYVFGEIKYKDIYGEEHFTKFRKLQGGANGINGQMLANADEGNEAD